MTSCYCRSRSISARQTARWVLIDTRRLLRPLLRRLLRFSSVSLPEALRRRIRSSSLRPFYPQIQLCLYRFQLSRRRRGRLDALTWRAACISLFLSFAKKLLQDFRTLKSVNFHPRRQRYLQELVPKRSHTRGRWFRDMLGRLKIDRFR